MSTAIVGLVGVVIGGLLTGALQFTLEVARERRASRAALRLVANELTVCLAAVDGTQARRRWREAEAFPKTAWEENKAIIAAGVKAEVWRALEGAEATVRFIRARGEAAKLRGDLTVHDDETEEIDDVRAELRGIVSLTRDAAERPRILRRP